MKYSSSTLPRANEETRPLISPTDTGTPTRLAMESVAFRYTQTESFVSLLQQLGAALLVSTYQANKLIAIRATGDGLSTLVRSFDRPMGMAADERQLTIGTRKEVWFLRNAPDIAVQVEPAGTFDACYLPRSSHVTGDIGVHEIAWVGNALWLVNTRFSCLCTLDPDYSFVPRWQPPFITSLVAEDRCHMNGLSIVNGRPCYVTALGSSDTRDGWRREKADEGCIIDVASGAFVARGLCMPHSPRWANDRLWVLESGTGSVMRVDPTNGLRETVAQLPGFARGMAITGRYAFIGLSKIRPTSAMDGVPLAKCREELKCGIVAVDLCTGKTVAVLEFQTAVEEIFDVQLLSGVKFPEVYGFQKESLNHTFVIPAR